jgi:hypothetical protein
MMRNELRTKNVAARLTAFPVPVRVSRSLPPQGEANRAEYMSEQ